MTLAEEMRRSRLTYLNRMADQLQEVIDREGDKDVDFADGWLCWDGKQQVYAPVLIERLRRKGVLVE